MDKHVRNLIDKRALFWVKRIAKAGNEQEIQRITAKIESLEKLMEEDSPATMPDSFLNEL